MFYQGITAGNIYMKISQAEGLLQSVEAGSQPFYNAGRKKNPVKIFGAAQYDSL